MAYNFVQCYTGTIGSRVLARAIEHPDFEVVGCLVSGDAKHGKDVGELVGAAPIGVKATKHLEDILELEADCAAWNGILATWPTSPTAAVEPPAAGGDALYRLLRSGKNVYSGIGGWYIDPSDPEWAELDAACREGGVSLAAGGNIPGLVTDALPMFASGFCGRVDRIWCKEADHVARYPSAHELQAHVGFGLPVDEVNPAEEVINALYEWALRQSARECAAAMGVELDSFRLVNKELAPAKEELKLDNGLLIPAGSCAGARWTFSGFVGDVPWYTVVVELTAAYGLAPDWRQDDTDPQFSVEIHGVPALRATVTALEGADDIGHICDLNAARALNMLPLICQAEPGFRSLIDLPFVTANLANPTVHGP